MTDALSPEQSRWVEQCVPRVTSLAKQLASRIPHTTLDDLLSAGYEGLVHAALRYEPDNGVPFVAYAHYRVRGAMLDAARRAAPEKRRFSRAMRALEASQALLEHAERKLVPRNAADPRSLRERVAAAAELVAQTTTAVLLAKLGPEDPDRVPTADGDAEAKLLHEEELAFVRRVVSQCSPDERRLFDAIYVQGISMREYAESIGKSVSTVSRQHTKLLARISEALRQPPPAPRAAPRPSDTAPPRPATDTSGLGPRGPPPARDS